jgi:hypothetical protein
VTGNIPPRARASRLVRGCWECPLLVDVEPARCAAHEPAPGLGREVPSEHVEVTIRREFGGHLRGGPYHAISFAPSKLPPPEWCPLRVGPWTVVIDDEAEGE